MNKHFNKLIFILAVLQFQLVVESRFELNFPLFRYALAMLASYYLVNSIKISSIFNKHNSFVFRLFAILILLLGLYSITQGIPDLSSPIRNYIHLKSFIGGRLLLFLIPFVLFSKVTIESLKFAVKFSFALLYIFCFFFLLDINEYFTSAKSPELIVRWLAGSAGFIILIFAYLPNKMRNFLFVILGLALLLMLLHARRNLVLFYGTSLILAYTINLINNKDGKSSIFLISRGLIAILFFLILIFVINLDFSLFVERASTGIESREGIIEEFLIDIKPMSFDFFLGRGINGTFYSYYLGYDEYGDMAPGGGQRNLIENGYLNIILNHGFLFLFSFVFLSIYGVIKGFFYSRNILSKAAASFLLVNLVDMIGYGVPELTYKYFFVWFSLTICFSREIRQYDDVYIKSKLVF